MKSDEERFRRELVASQGALYEQIAVSTASTEDAWDILQETNAALLRNILRWDCDLPLLPLFRRFAMLQTAAWRKRAMRNRIVFDEELFQTVAAQFSEQKAESVPADDVERLEDCLKRLPPEHMEIVRKHWWDGTPVRSLAKSMQVTANSLSCLLFRIRKTLRECIDKERRADDTSHQTLLQSVLEGSATDTERARLFALMKRERSLIAEYCQQMSIQALGTFARGKTRTARRFRVKAAGVAALFAAGFCLAGVVISARRSREGKETSREATALDGVEQRQENDDMQAIRILPAVTAAMATLTIGAADKSVEAGETFTVDTYMEFDNFYNSGVVEIVEGGTLFGRNTFPSWQSTSAANTETVRINIREGGTLRFNFIDNDTITKCYGTVYLDGGRIEIPRTTGYCATQFGNTHLVLSEKGGTIATYDGDQRIPGPIEGTGRLTIEGFKDKATIIRRNYNEDLPVNTFAGGLTVTWPSGAGNLHINSDVNLGAVPAELSPNIRWQSSGTLTAEGTPVLHQNRIISLAPNAQIHLRANGGNGMTVKSQILGENPGGANNGTVLIGGGNTAVPMTIAPPAGQTNRFGRLYVDSNRSEGRFAGEGTTILDSTSLATYSGNSFDVYAKKLSIESGTVIVTNANLFVEAEDGSGEITTNNCYATVRGTASSYGLLDISGGVLDLSGVGEFLNGYPAYATTTVHNAGTLICRTIRCAGYNSTEFGNSVLNIDEGGTLIVGMMYISNAGTCGEINFNGGTVVPVKTTNSNTAPLGYAGGNTTGATLHEYIREGGLVVSNDITCYAGINLLSGAEKDGGVTKWGSGVFAILSGGNTFNGPITVMQGSLYIAGNGSNNTLPTTATMRIAKGTIFNMQAANNKQTISRLEGSGAVTAVSNNLTVTDALAPGEVSGEGIGTLTIQGGGPLLFGENAALEIDIGEDGTCDCLDYRTSRLDLSALTVRIKNPQAMDNNTNYIIAKVPSGATGEAKTDGLPGGWKIRYDEVSKTVSLTPQRGTVVLLI